MAIRLISEKLLSAYRINDVKNGWLKSGCGVWLISAGEANGWLAVAPYQSEIQKYK